jgi:ATP-dependent helicase Lhr and Lhr-like helicase
VAGGGDEAAVRALLPRAWHGFYGRFGRLTAIQKLAAGPVAAGRCVLASAPTASGKTEALLAPLAERALGAGPGASVRILIVSPTRALVNDLWRRVRGPLGRVGIGAARKTGDSPTLPKLEGPTAIVTTPESFDSLLARHPAALRGVVAVVLDEVQLISRTARGDQLRCLLARLDRVAAQPPQRCAATATVADPGRLAAEFLGPGALVVQPAATAAEAQRPIEAELAPAATTADAAAAIARAFDAHAHEGRGGAHTKLLVFANTRAEVEGLAAALAAEPALRSRVLAHHGSLARGERLRVEALFRDAGSAICVATMTLELGIDVGDVDLIVLVAPPPDVASLLQRAGRGNRREAASRVLGLYDGELEQRRFEHLLECARAGRLFDEPVCFRPTVLAQQALSLLLQGRGGWVGAEALHARLPADVRATWTRGDCEAVLAALAAAGYVRPARGGRFVADERALPLLERGRVHSMIEDVRERDVVDALTGRALGRARFGKAEGDRLEDGGGGVSLALGGRRRHVTGVRDDKVFVVSEEGAEQARFLSREAPRYSAALAADFARFLGLEPGAMRLARLGQRGYRLDHFLGSTWGRVLEWVLTARKHRASGAGPFSLVLRQGLEPGALPLGGEVELAQTVRAVLARNRATLARMLGAGPFRDLVPPELVDRWVAESVDVDGLVARLRDARVADVGEVE